MKFIDQLRLVFSSVKLLPNISILRAPLRGVFHPAHSLRTLTHLLARVTPSARIKSVKKINSIDSQVHTPYRRGEGVGPGPSRGISCNITRPLRDRINSLRALNTIRAAKYESELLRPFEVDPGLQKIISKIRAS
jgi:hypothetical protein